MELFINRIAKRNYKLLNHLWDTLSFGSPHLIGLRFAIIEGKAFPTWKRWEEYYLQSGEFRLARLRHYSKRFREIIQNPDAFSQNEITWPVYQVNYFHGRTANEVNEIGNTLFNLVDLDHPEAKVSREEVASFVRFKIIGEPWNQNLLRYTRTVTRLRDEFPRLQVKRARLSFVGEYGFNGLIIKNDRPKAGLSIRSAGWLKQQHLLYNHMENYSNRLDEYRARFGSEVYVVYSQVNGEIANPDILRRINLKCQALYR